MIASPTYSSLGDHSEAIEIVYDPERISYHQLLIAFFDAHHPTSEPFSRQYRSAIFVHDDPQREAAQLAVTAREAMGGARIHTAIEPATTFWPAEDYHQKYRLQGDRELLAEVRAVYPDVSAWGSSTAVTRINAFLGGWGTESQLKRELPLLGLSEAGQERLRKVRRR